MWRFAGSDSKRGASKWCCPTGGRRPASRWVAESRLHPLLPRETPADGTFTRAAVPSSASSDA